MGINAAIRRMLGHLYLERPAKKKTVADYVGQLERSGQDVAARVKGLPDSEQNRQMLRHIIGLERWGQSRLRVGLGEPLVSDEYDSYRPDPALPWDQLQTTFQETRQTTIRLATELEKNQVDLGLMIPHNEWGHLSLRGWLRYLNLHAKIESKRMK